MGANAELVQRLTQEVFIEGNVARVDDLVDEDFTSHDPPPGFPPTREGLRQLVVTLTVALTERETEFDEVLDITDGRVVENWAMVGLHTGDLFGVPATDERIRIRGVEIWRCADGKIVEHWGAVDISDLFEMAQAASTP